MLLINPRKRRVHHTKKHTVARKRRHNPYGMTKTTHKRRRNPLHSMRTKVMHRRRRHNPIGRGMMGGAYMSMIRDALMGGAGAVVMDVVYAQVAKFLPMSMQPVSGQIGAGDAVKALVTVAIGHVLDKPTRGFTKKAAMASLIVQAHNIIKGYVPATLMPLQGLGYASPAMVAGGTNRVGPIRRGMNAYVPSGTPLLNAYQRTGGSSQLLSGSSATMRREGVSLFY
jgi:hypothetical protein